jgi:DNA-directed RNA polymerase subunit RPC12/RpoP
MSELKYYKLSGKINFKSYLIALLIAIIASYYLGKFYHYFNDQFYQFIIEKIFKSDVQSHSNEFRVVVTKLLTRGETGIILFIVVLIILLFPSLITLGLMAGIMDILRNGGKSRNRIVDTILFIPLSFLCFFVSNEYLITTIWDYIELSIFLILALIFAIRTTHYFCENCSKTYISTEFHTTSELNSDDYLEDVIKEGIDDEKRFEEKAILEKEDVENLYYVELNKCDTCGSQIVKIESKIIKVDSNGKKKIKDGKKITEDLIIS